jgi:hypothetical protein
MTTDPLASNQPLQPQLPPEANFKVVGLGGVGNITARYLAIFLAAQARGQSVRLLLIDGDRFETSNAARMFYTKEGNKASTLREELLPHFRDSSLSLIAVEEFITTDNIERLIRDGDHVILAVDNHATRKLVSDFCQHRLQNVCLISGGNDGVGTDADGRPQRGTFGNVQIYVRRDGRDLTPALTRHHPEINNPGDHLPTDLSCTELAASVPQIVFTNLQVASAILSTVYLYLCNAAHYSEVVFDIAEGVMRPIPLPTPCDTTADHPPMAHDTPMTMAATAGGA